MATGGVPAVSEALRMVSEKITALIDAQILITTSVLSYGLRLKESLRDSPGSRTRIGWSAMSRGDEPWRMWQII
jgi:hypothetical protein